MTSEFDMKISNPCYSSEGTTWLLRYLFHVWMACDSKTYVGLHIFSRITASYVNILIQHEWLHFSPLNLYKFCMIHCLFHCYSECYFSSCVLECSCAAVQKFWISLAASHHNNLFIHAADIQVKTHTELGVKSNHQNIGLRTFCVNPRFDTTILLSNLGLPQIYLCAENADMMIAMICADERNVMAWV